MRSSSSAIDSTLRVSAERLEREQHSEESGPPDRSRDDGSGHVAYSDQMTPSTPGEQGDEPERRSHDDGHAPSGVSCAAPSIDIVTAMPATQIATASLRACACSSRQPGFRPFTDVAVADVRIEAAEGGLDLGGWHDQGLGHEVPGEPATRTEDGLVVLEHVGELVVDGGPPQHDNRSSTVRTEAEPIRHLVCRVVCHRVIWSSSPHARACAQSARNLVSTAKTPPGPMVTWSTSRLWSMMWWADSQSARRSPRSADAVHSSARMPDRWCASRSIRAAACGAARRQTPPWRLRSIRTLRSAR